MTISRRDFLASSLAGSGLLAARHLGTAAAENEKKERPKSPFLMDNYGPIHKEIAANNLKVIGKLPPDMDGMFVRNGPNPQFPPILNYHWFEGDGMVHGVRIRDGKASYLNRWVRTEAWKDENKAGKALYSSILDPPDLDSFAKQMLAGRLPFPNKANTALVWHHGKLLALWEGGAPHEIKMPGLETIGPYTFGGKLKHAFTAHPKIDPKTGELIFFGYWPIAPYLQHSVADAEGKIISTTAIELPRSVMMHDFAITENYSVLLDMPATLSVNRLLRGKSLFQWEPNLASRIGILPRHLKGDDTKWFEVEAGFVFHVFNAYEEGDTVHLLACRYSGFPEFVDLSTDFTKKNGKPKAPPAPHPIVYRWSCNMKTGKVTEGPVDDVDAEFPRVNENLTGSKTRFGYAMSGDSRSSDFLKYDFAKGTSERLELGKGVLGGEGVFVPRQGGQTEDDGYLVSFVHDYSNDRSEMVVLDCRDFTGRPLARVMLPQRVPYGFHGLWVSDVG